MIRFLAVLIALATPAGAESLSCTISTSCSADGGCNDVEAGSIAAFTLADDGATGVLVYGGETMPLTRISEHVTGPTYMAEEEGGSRAFFSLYGDGTLSASTHEIDDSGIFVWLASGTCETVAP